MGCINSRKNNIGIDNVFRIRATRLSPDTLPRHGYLELNTRELMYTTSSSTTFVWSLQHLRRFGLKDDIFSFEAGRRCMTGPGIYTFRCHRSDHFYRLFVHYINAVSVVAEDLFSLRNRDSEHSVEHVNNSSTNHYLEPVPLVNNMSASLHNSITQSISILDNSDLAASFPTTFCSSDALRLGANNIPKENRCCKNDYLKYPTTTTHFEHNNNIQAQSESNTPNDVVHETMLGGADSTVSAIVNHRNLQDLPPEERAPILTSPTTNKKETPCHSYANVNVSMQQTAPDFPHENFCDAYINPALSVQRNWKLHSSMNFNTYAPSLQYSQLYAKSFDPNEPSREVNYIVLDLEKPGEQFRTQASFGTDFSIVGIVAKNEAEKAQVKCLPTMSVTIMATPTKQIVFPESTHQRLKDLKTESFGYSTIDFIKTCALIKTSTNEFDLSLDYNNEQAKARHNNDTNT